MKPWPLLLPIALLTAILPTSSCKGSSLDSSLYTVEVVSGVRHVHNRAPQLGLAPGATLEFIGKIGRLESNEERELLYDPVDAARLPNGDILVLEGSGCKVKRFKKDHSFLSAFGQKGLGPGDFVSPYRLRLTSDGKALYVADTRISKFLLDGTFERSFKPELTVSGGSIGAEQSRSGMALLSASRVILPSAASLWAESGESKLLSVYDETGKVIRSFGAVEKYEDPKLTLNANIAYFVSDWADSVYVGYAYQNRIDKYSPDGRLIFSADRPLAYELKTEMRAVLFKSGAEEREFPWAAVTSVVKGLGLDQRNKLWVLTFLRQPNKFGEFEEGRNLADCYEYQVFDENGVFLFRVPFPNVRFDRVSMNGDRLFLIDSRTEACVYEYRILDATRLRSSG
jgi:hypothetical protein